MTRSSRTRCWGLLLAFGLQLPPVPPATPDGGQPAPPPVTATASRTPWEPAWSLGIGSTADLLLAVSRDHVFTAGPSSPLVARDADSGAVAWTHEITGWDALVATPGLVLGVAGEHAYALDAATGQTRWITQTTGDRTRLVVAGDRLLMVSDTDALLRETGTGAPLGRVGLDAAPSSPPVLAERTAIVPLVDARLVAFDIAAGLQLWESKLRRPASGLTAAGPSIFVALPDGTLQAIDARNGTVRWSFPLRVPLAGAPFVDEDAVYVVLLDNSLRAFDRRSGAMQRTDGLGHRPAAGPWVTGASAVIGLTTGEFLVLEPASGRVVTRLAVPDGGTTNVLEAAALGPETFWLASLTIAPGGERRLSAYRHRPAATVTTQETVSDPRTPDAGPEEPESEDREPEVPEAETGTPPVPPPPPPSDPAPEEETPQDERPTPVPSPFPLPR